MGGQPGLLVRNSNSQKGFSLVEVMVSMVLLTASMLGLVSLQKVSTKFDHQAYLRTQSVIQAGAMIEKLRANYAGASKGYYIVSPVPESYRKNCNSAVITCSHEELATYDVVTWNRQNANLLPGGTGLITGNTATSTYMISVQWTEQKKQISVGDDYKNPCDGSKKEDLHCYQLEVRL